MSSEKTVFDPVSAYAVPVVRTRNSASAPIHWPRRCARDFLSIEIPWLVAGRTSRPPGLAEPAPIRRWLRAAPAASGVSLHREVESVASFARHGCRFGRPRGGAGGGRGL